MAFRLAGSDEERLAQIRPIVAGAVAGWEAESFYLQRPSYYFLEIVPTGTSGPIDNAARVVLEFPNKANAEATLGDALALRQAVWVARHERAADGVKLDSSEFWFESEMGELGGLLVAQELAEITGAGDAGELRGQVEAQREKVRTLWAEVAEKRARVAAIVGPEPEE